ncbi:MAG TPA: F0F1 ATP synthase subunit A [Candidatus Moranbacteria bacterium]|jgi:F-type H+-transporting ATPase subunit a|nr:F0F1 ATP synthase subunit A [Candidatus Moranbacteria bacterium]HOF42302.1 F0F1 ATP synthase subunit A [Candidatus Moranbacteria bacterium]HPX94279.1 F0F1 ATP synthase subunit A [Candidatus Moranbacteria bacterium]HQB59730.1 F0F1 ATP synthase subunit A [Candidatus Moranbacteria bacterium]
MTISLAPEPLFHIGNFIVTNTLIVTLALSAIIIAASFAMRSRLQLVPKGFQNVFEYVIEAVLGLVDSVTQNREQSKKFFPIVMTIFLFVILSNWVELIPGLGTVGVYGEHHGENVLIPFLRSSSADLNVTLAIALISVFTIQFMGIAAIGAAKYAGKFFVSPFHKPYFIGTFVGILELISEIAKIISFSFRLFGNIFAGEVLLIVMLNLVPYFVPLPFLFLELFVGFVQALVFAMLTLVFLKMAVTETSH